MDIPQDLEQRLRQKQVIPFVGAGVSMAVCKKGTDKSLFPSWKQLLLQVADRLGKEFKKADADFIRASLQTPQPKYLEAAEHARQALGPILYDVLKEEIDKRCDEADSDSLRLAQSVWDLGKLIITTNYDRVLQWASPAPNDVGHWDIEAPVEQKNLLQNKLTRPVVWHLHGHIDNATNLILTPDGYKRLYPEKGNTESRYNAAITTLRTLLASHCFLFIGFSLDDEHFGMQLRGVDEIFDGNTGKHYALLHKANRERFRSLNFSNIEPIFFEEYGESLINCVCAIADVANAKKPEVIETTEELISSIDFALITPADFSPEKRVFFVPFVAKGDQVVGREQAMQEVRQQLQSGKRTSIGQTASFLGLGGLGKTQLAIEYAYADQDKYPNGVIWISADQDIDSQLIRLADEARWIAPQSEHKDKLAIALHRLRSVSDCLIIFDNVEDESIIKHYLPLPAAKPHILITSRTEQAGFIPIKIDLLDEATSLQMLLQEAGKAPHNEEDKEAATKIVEALGGLPLALELAGAYLRNREVSWKEYWELLDRNLKAALPAKFSQASFTRHEADLYSTLRISQEVFQGEPQLKWVLDLLTWSGAAPMSKELMAAALSVETESELTGALGLGTALRLLQRSPSGNRYSLHRLVRRVRREEIPLESYNELAQGVCRRMGDWFQTLREDFTALPRFEVELDHVSEWAKNAENFSLLEASRLTWLQAYPHYHRGNYKQIETKIRLAITHYESSIEKDPSLLAHLYNDLGYSFFGLGQYKIALGWQEKALNIRLNIFGEDHPDTARSYNNVGGSYNQLERYDTALNYSKKSLDFYLKHYGENHPDTARSFDNVGECFSDLEQNDEALRYKEKALTIRLKICGENHPDTAASYNSIGNSYGQSRQALNYAEKALKIRLEILGDHHPATIESHINCAIVLNKQGKSYLALQRLEKVIRGLPQNHLKHTDLQKVIKDTRSQLKGFRKDQKPCGRKKKKRK